MGARLQIFSLVMVHQYEERRYGVSIGRSGNKICINSEVKVKKSVVIFVIAYNSTLCELRNKLL